MQVLPSKYLSLVMAVGLLFNVMFNVCLAADEPKEPASALKLQDALNLAMRANPEIAVTLREREAVESMQAQANVRPNPTLSASIQDTRSNLRQTFLQLNQEIELGNKRAARLEAADAYLSKADAALDSKKADIHANVVAAFYAVLVSQERLSLAKSSLEIANLGLGAAAKRVRAGKSAPVEETKSKIAAAGAKIAVIQAESQLVNSKQQLTALWGNALPVFTQAEGSVTIIPEIGNLKALSMWLDTAPSIKLAMLEINTRAAITKIEQSKKTQNITISAGVDNNQELGGRNQVLLGLSVPIPVFDRNQGRFQESISRQYKAQDELTALKNQLAASLANQYARYVSAKQAAETFATEILPGAQSSFEVANKGFSAGKFGFFDVLDAQRTLFQTKSQYIEALQEAHQALAEIERILGDVVSHPNDKLQE
jgi:outer membrane protein, heavy metal efflux system